MTSSLTVVSRAALALTGVLLPTWAAATHLPAPPPPLARVDPPLGPSRPDVYGDPLPVGAVSRMGTVRLRHGGVIAHVAFAPDGKTLYSASPEDKFVRAWEVRRRRRGRRAARDG
jgi:hypothetical protein